MNLQNKAPYRTLADMPIERKERFIALKAFWARSKKEFVYYHRRYTAIVLLCSVVVALIGGPLYWIHRCRQEQRATAQHWAQTHNMRVVTCLDVSNYCECSVTDGHSGFVVKVTDDDPDRVFSAIASQL